VGDTLCPVKPRSPQQTAEESERVERGNSERAHGEDDEQPGDATRAAVRKAVQRRLEDEVEGRDTERSARYVATVRPSQAATKYVRSDVSGKAAGRTGAALAEQEEPVGQDDGDAEEGGTVMSDATTDSAWTQGRTSSDMAVTKASSTGAGVANPTGVARDETGSVVAMEASTPANDGDGVAKKSLSPVRKAAKKRRAARAALRAKTRARVAEADRLAAVATTTRRR
jgi:hypothetical protein